MTNAITKKTIIEAILLQIEDLKNDQMLAKQDVTSLRSKLLSAPHSSVERDLKEAEADASQIAFKIKSLNEALIQINNGFGW